MTSDSDLSPEERMDALVEQAAVERQINNRLRRNAADYAEDQRRIRYTLLRIHAWMAIIVGVTVLFTGTAQIFEITFGTWTRPALGGLALVAGSTLLAGIDSRGGSKRHLVEMAGLAMKTLWDIAMSLGFVLAIWQYGAIEFRMPWDLGVIDPLQPRPYGPFIYLGLFSMITIVHLPACWRDLRNQRG